MTNLLFITTVVFLYLNRANAAEKVDWWEAASIYQIYPKSFMDSNGDGVGDLNGVTSRLKYIREIGMDAVWLSPIYKSPMADNGYDVANFTDIDPVFGTIDDFDRMLHAAHKLGIKVLLDFVPNHSSDEGEWFQKSIRRDPEYEDFYMWEDGKINQTTGERIPPNNWQSTFGGPGWAWVEERQQYYWHQFLVKQPDFDLRNPKVRRRLMEVMGFWLDRGVDGFRIDAIPFYIEKRLENGTYPDQPMGTVIFTENQPECNELLYEWREYLDNYKKKHGGETRFMLGEAYGTIDGLSDYVNNGTHAGIQMSMNLNLVYVRDEINATLFEYWADYWQSVMWTRHRVSNWVIGNHDNFRVASRMGHSRVDLMAILMHAMPGASVTYNGEEIGMTNGATGCEVNCNYRDVARTPMQWDNTKNSGFSKGDTTWLPINPNYQFLNVQTQRNKARSSLHIFKEMVKLKKSPAFKAFKEDGAFEYGALSEQVFHIMRTDKATEEYRVFVNFGAQIEYVKSLVNKTMEYAVLNLYSPHKMGERVDLRNGLYLMPFEAVVLHRKL